MNSMALTSLPSRCSPWFSYPHSLWPPFPQLLSFSLPRFAALSYPPGLLVVGAAVCPGLGSLLLSSLGLAQFVD